MAGIALLLGVGSAASASHCDDDMVIFSGAAEGPKPNLNTLCAVAKEQAGDTRLINPGSSEIVVRFTGDFGAAYPQISAIVDGLGFANQTIILTREPGTAGGFVYDSADLPLNPNARGCIRARLTPAFGGATAGSTAFHTFGASC